MTDQEINIAIAEACGWKWKPGKVVPFGADHPEKHWHDQSGKIAHRVPGYCSDLNAMASAETYAQKDLMNADQWENYGRLLYKAHPTAVITDSNGVLDFYAIAELMTGVTARQRAEAFLRTIGKWKEEVTA